MAKKKIWFLVVLLLVLGGGGTLLKFRGGQEAIAVQKPVVTLEFAPNDVALAQMRELRQVIPLSGNLQAVNQTMVKAKVSGEIREALVREGEAVKRGQILARFDSVDFQSRLDEKIANLEGARAQLGLAEKNQQNNLFLVRQKFISQNAYDNTQSSLQVSQATLKSYQAQVDLARNALRDTEVRSPLDGFVAKRHVQAGEKVSQDTPLFAIVDLTRMELQAPVPASDIPNVRIGQEASIRVDGNDKKQYSGRVERINPASEAGSRSINVYIAVTNPENSLKVGMFASGELRLSSASTVLAIPISAVHSENGQPYVFTLEAGKLVKRPVELGQSTEQEGLVEVRTGLGAGTTVVAARIDGLKPGTPAIVKTEPAATVNKG